MTSSSSLSPGELEIGVEPDTRLARARAAASSLARSLYQLAVGKKDQWMIPK